MKNIILISPFSKPLRNFNQNPKNFPHWQKLITELNQLDYIDEIWQIGVGNEYRFEGVTHKFNLLLDEVEKLANQAILWISVDNFFPHLCNAQNVRTQGIVLYSKSDPKHFSYKQNIILLKSDEYLRPDQFGIWEQCDFEEKAFVSVGVVLDTIDKYVKSTLD